MSVWKFSLSYFLILFTIGFVLGILRNLVLNPLLGPLLAVVLEVPLMLVLSKLVAAKLLKKYRFTPRQALLAGALAFLQLLLAEYLTFLAFRLGVSSQFLTGFITTHGLVGLIGQLGFALLPWVIVKFVTRPKGE